MKKKSKKNVELRPDHATARMQDATSGNNKLVWLSALLIAFITFLVYLPALQNGFVNWDDPNYVYVNPNIQSLDYRFLKWSFTNAVASLWHPLTLFSLAIDYALWRHNPFGYHLTNTIIHVLNTCLVFILAVRLQSIHERFSSGWAEDLEFPKKKILIAIATAIIFGIHPIHVESVAWISERKDVLCAVFFLMTMLAYLNYATANSRRRRVRYYLLCVALFLLALMSKPMAVSLPIVLLFIDFYPLKRLNTRFVLVEKIPFLVLSLISSLLTISFHRTSGALMELEAYPWQMRLFTAVSAYIMYLLKMVMPFNLAPIYPLPKEIDFSSPVFIIPFILLITMTIFCFRTSNKSYLTTWFYYIVTLIPVIGIVQVGSQAMADRYTYLPSIGPFLLVGVGIGILFGKLSHKRQKVHASIILIAIMGLLSFVTVRQISVWRDSITLWTFQIKLYPVAVAYNNRGNVYQNMGNHQQAIIDYTKAIEIDPRYAIAYNNRGSIYDTIGAHMQAIDDYNMAIKLNPGYLNAYFNRGNTYANIGANVQAIDDYSMAIKLNPEDADVYKLRGISYGTMGNYRQALNNLKKAIELNPEDQEAQYYLRSAIEQ